MEIGTEKKKIGLSTQIFIALLAGALCGVCVHYFLSDGCFKDTILGERRVLRPGAGVSSG